MSRFAFVGVVAAIADDMSWEDWKSQHGRSYNNVNEDTARRNIFEKNVDLIEAHNAKNSTYRMEVNMFADLTEAEFLSQYAGLSGVPPSREDAFLGTHEEDDAALLDAVDWVDRGAVNPIKNQGQCGSCWAFSAVGTLESAYQISSGTLLSLSEQQLVDCDGTNSGCSGGWPWRAYDNYYHATNAAVCSESSYSYTAVAGGCQASSCTQALPGGMVSGHISVGQTSSALMSALLRQPVSVTVYAAQLQFYANGVVTGECSGTCDHAVIAVGYGTDGLDYFRIRNSWGTGWGESGYIRLGQSGGSQGTACLLQYAPAYPSLFSPGCGGEQCSQDSHAAFKTPSVPDADSCCQACTQEPNCAGWIWKKSKCHLKKNAAYVKTGCTSFVGSCDPCGLKVALLV